MLAENELSSSCNVLDDTRLHANLCLSETQVHQDQTTTVELCMRAANAGIFSH